LLIAADRLVARRSESGKGRSLSHFGLVLRGPRAVQIGLGLVRAHYPELDPVWPKPDAGLWKETARRPVSGSVLADFSLPTDEDGNLGAWTACRRILADEEDGAEGGAMAGKTDFAMLLGALEAEAQPRPERRKERHGLRKGIVLAGRVALASGMRKPAVAAEVGDQALHRIALDYLEEGRLLPCAILADHLPADRFPRDDLSRILAACLARGQRVTADLPGLFDAPLGCDAGVLLATLLLEGQASDVAAFCTPGDDWLSGLPPGLQDLIVHAARLAATGPGRRIVIPETAPRKPDEGAFRAALKEIAAVVEAERQRSLVGEPKQVIHLQRALFETPGAFQHELHAVHAGSSGMAEPDLASAVQALVEGRRGDLHDDLLAKARKAGTVTDSKKLAQGYWSQRNDAVARETHDGKVMLNLGGRYTERATIDIFAIVIARLVPYLIARADPDLAGLAQAARALQADLDATCPAAEFPRRILARRLAKGQDISVHRDAPWVLPLVRDADLSRGNWGRAFDGWLHCEFPAGTEFREVLDWFTGKRLPASLHYPLHDLPQREMMLRAHEITEMAQENQIVGKRELLPALRKALERITAPLRDQRLPALGQLCAIDGLLPPARCASIRATMARAETILRKAALDAPEDDLILELDDLIKEIEAHEEEGLVLVQARLAQMTEQFEPEFLQGLSAQGRRDHAQGPGLLRPLRDLRALHAFALHHRDFRSVALGLDVSATRQIMAQDGRLEPDALQGLDRDGLAVFRHLRASQGHEVASLAEIRDVLAPALCRFLGLGLGLPASPGIEVLREADAWHILVHSPEAETVGLRPGASRIEVIVPDSDQGEPLAYHSPTEPILVLGRRADSPGLSSHALTLNHRQIALAASQPAAMPRRLYLLSCLFEQKRMTGTAALSDWWATLPAEPALRRDWFERLLAPGWMGPAPWDKVPPLIQRLAAWMIVIEGEFDILQDGGSLSLQRIHDLCRFWVDMQDAGVIPAGGENLPQAKDAALVLFGERVRRLVRRAV
jgi:hypothetical protein